MLKYHIRTVQLTATQNTIQINSIPQDYDDLFVVFSLRNDADSSGSVVRFNNDASTSNYSQKRFYGSGTAVAADTFTNLGYFAAVGVCASTKTANTFGNGSLHIANYKGNTVKSVLFQAVTENNTTFAWTAVTGGIWNQTAPITAVSFSVPVGNLVAGSTVSIYGVKRGSDGVTLPAAIGGTVTTSGGYTIHTFNTSGTFTAFRPLECEYLVVAGGGGGGGDAGLGVGGGGGAGGFLASTVNFLNGAYSITIGAGGAGGSPGLTGSNGSDSSISLSAFNVTSVGGGGAGGQNFSSIPSSGGSGGGAGGNGNGNIIGGSGTAGQGFKGGDQGGLAARGAGGGGAGEVGQDSQSTTGAKGGDGLQWLNGTYYAGGGGGSPSSSSGTNGAGGLGGGGIGGNPSTTESTAGEVNTGGGGGGAAGGTFPGLAGGSGIVIIRYLTP